MQETTTHVANLIRIRCELMIRNGAAYTHKHAIPTTIPQNSEDPHTRHTQTKFIKLPVECGSLGGKAGTAFACACWFTFFGDGGDTGGCGGCAAVASDVLRNVNDLEYTKFARPDFT
jgi:hypothetical protein